MNGVQHSAGETLSGRYQLKRKLGEGAFGEVWIVDDIVSRAEVVLKLLLPQWAVVPEMVERFRREAEASKRIHHASACKVYDFARTDSGQPFITMEYLAGGTLKKELEKAGRLTIKRTATWMVPVCEAVAEAHAAGIVHRDLKPENIMMRIVDGEEVPVVLDFGIAKLLDADQKLTQTGSLLGSPAYMSPEQCKGMTDVGPAADVYALAIMVYELTTGSPPFVSKSFAELAVKHTIDPPPPITGVPPTLAKVVMACLAKEPSERPLIGVLVAALRTAVAEAGQVSGPTVAPPVKRPVSDSHDAATRVSSGPNKEIEAEMARLVAAKKEKEARLSQKQAPAATNPLFLIGGLLLLAAAGVALGLLLR